MSALRWIDIGWWSYLFADLRPAHPTRCPRCPARFSGRGRDCDVDVPPKMFMCRRHWFSLPKAMRDEIWLTYRPRQEVTKTPSTEYLMAAREAVNYIDDRAV